MKLLLALFLLVPASFLRAAPTPLADGASAGAAQTKTATTLPSLPPATDAAELTVLLKDFLEGASRNDVTTHDRFWAEDLVYTSSNGRRMGKADIMRDVRQEGPPKPGEETTIFGAEDIRIQQYGTTAIIAFRLIGTTKKRDKTEVANYLNTGTFLKRNGKWQAVSWQATKVPAEDETKK